MEHIETSVIDYIQEFGGDSIQRITPVPAVDGIKYFRGCPIVLEAVINYFGRSIVLMIGLPSNFPRSLPIFFDRKHQFGFIPHVEKDGMICFTRSETIVLDERYPGAIILDCLSKVIQVLRDGELGRNSEDFTTEFESYWCRRPHNEVHVLLDQGIKFVREIDVYELEVGGKTECFVTDRHLKAKEILQRIYHLDVSKGHRYRGMYFPLEPGTKLIPPSYNKNWTNHELNEHILPNLKTDNKDRFWRIIKRKSKTYSSKEFVVVNVPVGQNSNVLFGASLLSPGLIRKQNRKGRISSSIYIHPLIHPSEIEIETLSVKERLHPEFLIERTGGNPTYAGNHIVVIGVGSVGSPVAMGFARAGVKKLTLIDQDSFSIQNIYRHELGASSVYTHSDNKQLHQRTKVLAMKEEIESKYPFTEVTAIGRNVIKVIEDELIDWDKVDLVVVAIGSPNAEMFINRYFHSRSNPPVAMFAWVEPLGIGGHVLVTNNGVKSGCYQCLFRSVLSYEPISNLASFCKPYQDFSKALTGCGSTFTPYSFLDSAETSHLILRIATKILLKVEKDNGLYSWKGDPTLLLNSGYQLSRRFEMSQDELYEKRTLYKDNNCPVCNGGRA